MRIGLRVIRDEHRSLAAVVDGLCLLARQAADGATAPDFALFEAIIAYLAGFPARQHHPKEDSVLFPAIRRRSSALDDVIAILHDQHQDDYRRVAELHRQLDQWRGDSTAGAAFLAAAQDYARFTLAHIQAEEAGILHALPNLLTEDDWAAIDQAFAANHDPLSGAEADFDSLFRRIVSLAPAPIGLGSPPA